MKSNNDTMLKDTLKMIDAKRVEKMAGHTPLTGKLAKLAVKALHGATDYAFKLRDLRGVQPGSISGEFKLTFRDRNSGDLFSDWIALDGKRVTAI